MLDINLIREQPDIVRAALLKRMDEVDFTALLQWDIDRRAALTECETLKAEKNRVSKSIPAKKKAGEDVSAAVAEMKEVSVSIAAGEAQVAELDARISDFLCGLPNLPADDVVAGGKENNQVVRTWGEKPVPVAAPKDHVELAESLGLIDYKRGVKMGGSGFWVYRGIGAQLEWGLLNYFIESHIADGYEFMLPPHLLTEECGYTAGQFPKFKDDVFHLRTAEDERGHFLLPTAETALINFHREEVLNEADLPLKYFAYTPCYRKEAGSYRTSERGMIRGHQFNKVEMFQYTTPAQSDAALEELIGKAERLMQGLGLHYQVSKLAARDCSAGMAKTYDIEVWIPSMNEYKEVSSASNAREYQARRGMIRYKPEAGGKPAYVHSLNASGLATSRLLPALLEQGQQADGSVLVPEPLQRWVGAERIEA